MEMTRGEIQDLLAKFASEDSAYRQALIANPRDVIEKQFQTSIPSNVQFNIIEDSADSMNIVLPHEVAAGDELSDADLEAVAGGGTLGAAPRSACGACASGLAVRGSPCASSSCETSSA